MRERHGVPVQPVVHAGDPAATAGFDAVNRVVGHILKNSSHHRLGEVQHQLAHLRAGADHLVQAPQPDLGAEPEACTLQRPND
jgi:hypothetical protein